MTDLSLMENNPTCSLPEDVLVQILSRLPKKSLHRFKSVSKEWHAHISTLHRFPRQSSDSGFLLQTPLSPTSLLATFFHLHPPHGSPISHHSLLFLFRRNTNSLSVRPSPLIHTDFHLPSSSSSAHPPNFSIASSSNGFLLLLLRTPTSSFHVYHPPSNLFLSLPPPPTTPSSVGFAAHPSHYHVVLLSLSPPPQPSGNPLLLFHIFSSPTGKWRKKTVRAFSSHLPDTHTLFVRGHLHWLWREHLLVFRLADNCHQIVDLPQLLHGFATRSCMWEAEGSLHYCDGSLHRLRIWVLLSEGWFYRSKRRGFGWQLKHDILLRVSEIRPSMDICCRCSFPCGFNDDFEILYLWEEGGHVLLSLNLVTGVLKEVWRCPSVKFQDIFPFFYGVTDLSQEMGVLRA